MKHKKKPNIREVGMNLFEALRYLYGPSRALEDLLSSNVLENESLSRYQELMSIVLHCRLLAIKRRMTFDDTHAKKVFDKVSTSLDISEEEILSIKYTLNQCRKVLVGSTNSDNKAVGVEVQLYELLHKGVYAGWGETRTGDSK